MSSASLVQGKYKSVLAFMILALLLGRTDLHMKNYHWTKLCIISVIGVSVIVRVWSVDLCWSEKCLNNKRLD